ncbi:MAG: hypothetical protein DI590_26525 [Methylorubrum populi]|jgi:hypothetical protein|nr:hypothetical protein AX289_29290 [Methylorubrum populi]PZP65666.1 MAG: hypothetical protein DI590_26525 [Methylorubrum populi]
MHAQVRLSHSGLLIAVNSGTESDERLIPWEEIDHAADLDVMMSSETLTAVEKCKRSATAAAYTR